MSGSLEDSIHHAATPGTWTVLLPIPDQDTTVWQTAATAAAALRADAETAAHSCAALFACCASCAAVVPRLDAAKTAHNIYIGRSYNQDHSIQ